MRLVMLISVYRISLGINNLCQIKIYDKSSEDYQAVARLARSYLTFTRILMISSQ